MVKIKKEYKKSKDYSKDIINKVCEVLNANHIEYSLNSGNSEITVSSKDQTEDTLFKTLYSNMEIPKVVFTILVDVVGVGDKIYIRQKTK